MTGASLDTVIRRCRYGGRKGRSAARRLSAGILVTGPGYTGLIRIRTVVGLTGEPPTWMRWAEREIDEAIPNEGTPTEGGNG